MDGVLADFDRGVKEICHMEPVKYGQRNDAEVMELWERVKKAKNYYYQLKPMEGAVEMFQQLRQRFGDRCEILSAIPAEYFGIVSAKEDKIRWVRDYLDKEVVINIVYRSEKADFAKGKDYILVDDYEKNIREWEEAGGSGILYQNASQALADLEGILERL